MGLYTDKHLNWQPQIQHVNIELAKSIGILSKLRYLNRFEYTETNLLCLNISLFELRYPAAWGYAGKTRLDCLRIKQNRFLRTIFFMHPFQTLTTLKLDNIHKLKICWIIRRIRNEIDSIPDIFLDVLTPASRIHNYKTRFVSKLNYFRSRVSTNLRKMSFKFSAPKIWEILPLGLKGLPYYKFKKEWKSYLLINQI